tara:strand:- start:1432 stop:1755 length:324 start_codon:yes stop_codon:yes gene_type:complete
MTLEKYFKEQGWGPHHRRAAHLAERCGVSRQMIGLIVRGHRRPSLKVAIAIEDATGGLVTVRELAGLSRQPKREKHDEQRQRSKKTLREDERAGESRRREISDRDEL